MEHSISPPSGFARKAAFSLFAQVTTFLANFAVGLLVARVLGPEGKGAYALITSGVALLFSFVSLGMSFAFPYFIGQRKWPPIPTLLMGTGACFAAFLLVTAVVVMLGPHRLLHEASISPTTAYFFLVFALLSLPLSIVGTNLAAVLRARELIIETTWPGIVNSVLRAALVAVLLLWIRPELGSVIFADLSAQAVGVFLTFVVFVWAMQHWWPPQENPSLRHLLSYGLQVVAGSFLFMVHTRGDLFLVNYYLSESAVGIYSVAMVLAELSRAATQPIFSVFFPRLNLLNAEQRKEWLLKVHRVAVAITALSTGILAAGAYLLPFIYGPKFKPATIPALICLVGCFTWPPARVIAHFLLSEAKMVLNILATFAAIVCMFAVDVALIPRLGVVGAAIGYTASLLVHYCMLASLARKAFNVNPWHGFKVDREDCRVIISSLKALLKR